ncbi:MAG: 50S ribosomal protein L23 [Patescibacteria group bacterium]
MAIIETKKEDKKENKVIAEKSKTQFSGKADFASRFLIEPWITEKSHQEMAQNKYIFRVSKDSSKVSVKKAVEDLYKVSVLDVNVVNIPPKKRIYGKTKGFKSGFKKAIVKLKKGDKIELFEGV